MSSTKNNLTNPVPLPDAIRNLSSIERVYAYFVITVKSLDMKSFLTSLVIDAGCEVQEYTVIVPNMKHR